MSTLTERVAYLKGLCEGMKLDDSSNESKVLLNIVDLLEEFALELEEMDIRQDELEDVIDEMDEDLAELEDEFYEIDDSCDCGCEDEEDDFVEIECPHCGETSYFDIALLAEPTLVCPSCNETIYDDEDEEDEKED